MSIFKNISFSPVELVIAFLGFFIENRRLYIVRIFYYYIRLPDDKNPYIPNFKVNGRNWNILTIDCGPLVIQSVYFN